MIPVVYRRLLRDTQARRLLLGLGVSALGDGMSTVSIAWLAVLLAPSGGVGVFVGLAVAAYTLPEVAIRDPYPSPDEPWKQHLTFGRSRPESDR